MIKIYVKSRGVSKDYCWLDGQQKIDKPPELPKFKVDVDDFALILQRQGDKLALLVNSLTSSKRVDSQNRKIRNFVLWVADQADESYIRSLVIQALGEDEQPLGDQLAAQLDEIISSTTTEPGFQVDFSKMENLAKEISRLEGSESSSEAKIANLSTFKADLRNELMRFSFPKGDGLLLVIVAPNVSETNLKNQNVWRGLSNQIDSNEGWIPLKKKQSFFGRFSAAESGEFQEGEGTSRKFVMLLGWLVAFILLVFLIQSNRQHQKELDELKEYRSLTIDKQQLRKENKKLADRNNKLQKENEKLTTSVNELQDLIEESEDFLDLFSSLFSSKAAPIIERFERYKQLGSK